MYKNDAKELFHNYFDTNEIADVERAIAEVIEENSGIKATVKLHNCKFETSKKSDNVKLIIKAEIEFNVNEIIKTIDDMAEQKLEEVYLEEEES